MFITPAFAQAPAAGGGDFLSGPLGILFPMVAMFLIVYFLVLRPQQKRMKDHQALLKGIRRGDTIVTNGGLIGKVTKSVDTEAEVEVEIADGVRARIVRSMIADVRAKGEPVKDKA